jgi:hypothetical protein
MKNSEKLLQLAQILDDFPSTSNTPITVAFNLRQLAEDLQAQGE